MLRGVSCVALIAAGLFAPCEIALADSLTTMGVSRGAPAVGGSPASFTKTYVSPDFVANGASSTTTFSSVPVNTPGYILVGSINVNNGPVVSETICGVAATRAVRDNASGAGTEIWYAFVASGSTCQIDVVTTGVPSQIAIAVGTLTTTTGTPGTPSSVGYSSSGGSATISLPSLTIPASGVGVVFGVCYPASTSCGTNAANWTADGSGGDATNGYYFIGHSTTAGATVPTVATSGAFQFGSGVAAPWGS